MFSDVNHLCNFGRGHYEEHLCEIILNLDQWFVRCRLRKKFTDDCHNSSHSAFGSGELKKVYFLYTFPWDLCLIKALI